jgi:hypothetical protein
MTISTQDTWCTECGKKIEAFNSYKKHLAEDYCLECFKKIIGNKP